eukprot:2164387-Ditylum_brightwellii.AAC.1
MGIPFHYPIRMLLSQWPMMEMRKRIIFLGGEDGGEAVSLTQSRESIVSDDPLLPKDILTAMDRKLIEVYANTIHNSNGLQLDGGCVDNKQWQMFWKYITALPSQRYDMPTGKVGKQFIFLPTKILNGVIEQIVELGVFHCFTAVILKRQAGGKLFKDVCRRTEH